MNQNNIKWIVGLLVVASLGAVFYFFGPQAKDRTVAVNVMEKIENEDLNFSFTYESGETALSSMETLPQQSENPNLLKMYVLMESKALDEFNKDKENEEGREAPPAISVLVFERASTTEAENATSSSSFDRIKKWAEDNSQFSSINLAQGNIEETKIDGAPAIHYQADGLYAQDIYVVKYGKRMYLFVGQHLEEGDYMQTSYNKLIGSVLFE